MKQIVPVFGDLNSSEQARWINALAELIPDVRFAALQDLTEEEKNDVTVAVVANPSPKDIATLPALVWVQSLWAGVEKLIQFFTDSPIKVVRLQDPALANTMAEAALTWTLFLHRKMHLYVQQQAQQVWQQFDYVAPEKRTVTVLGLGNLGLAIVAILKKNGFNVVGWSRTLKSIDSVKCYSGIEQLNTVLGQSDIIISVLPHTPETSGLFDADRFAAVKSGSQIINFGRGSLIVEYDLSNALDLGYVEHAVLDVFNNEPLPQDHFFWSRRQITVLPHISAQTRVDTASLVAAANIKNYLSTGEIPEFVDFEKGY